VRLVQLFTAILLVLASFEAAAYAPRGETHPAIDLGAAGDAPCHQPQPADDGGCDPQMICAMLCGALPGAVAPADVAFRFWSILFQLTADRLAGAIAEPDQPPPRVLIR